MCRPTRLPTDPLFTTGVFCSAEGINNSSKCTTPAANSARSEHTTRLRHWDIRRSRQFDKSVQVGSEMADSLEKVIDTAKKLRKAAKRIDDVELQILIVDLNLYVADLKMHLDG